MRLTALCVCGTLLAFSSLFWITADSDEGVLLDLDSGFGPCTATLIPEEPCRQGQHESTCPYLFSLPPLTVQLPQQLRELERIVQDLEKLKDSVDQLREMCADCSVSHTDRQCGRQRELDKPNEDDDERRWLNERLQESDRDYREEGGTSRGKEENMEGDGDSGKSFTLEEKERKDWEEKRGGDEGVLKENKDQSVSGGSEKDDKTTVVGSKQKNKVGQPNTSTAGGDVKITKPEIKNVAEKNKKKSEPEKNKQHATKGSLDGHEEAKEEKGEQKKGSTNVKNKEQTGESEHLETQYETEETKKKTQTEASDRIKMSVDQGVHTNREQGEREEEERKREMEKGTKVEQNNEKPKQAESIGHSEKEKTIKVGEEGEEDRETGEEIKPEGEKTERAQGNGDGELSSSKAIERTDFVSVSPTPDSPISAASGPDSSDSNKAVIFTSSLPSPSLPSSTSGLITKVRPETVTAFAPTRSSGLRAAGVSEQPNPDAELVAATTPASSLGGPGRQRTSTAADLITASGVKPVSGFQGHISPTTSAAAPYENPHATESPHSTERSHWAAKRNVSSNTKAGVKPLPGRGPKPGERSKPETKPDADQEPKNPKNDRKPDRGHFPDKKTKNDPKQKLPHNKPATNQTKPANVPKRVQNLKPDQKFPPDFSSTDQKNTPKPKHDRTRAPNRNKQPAQKPKSNQKALTPAQRPPQRPQAVNTTRPDGDPSFGRKKEPEENPNTDQNRKTVYPDNRLDGKRKNEVKKGGQETKRTDQIFEQNGENSNVQEPEIQENEMSIFAPKPDQDAVTESHKELVVNPSPKSNKDSTPVSAQETSPDQSNTQPDERNKKSPTFNKKPVIEENPLFESTSDKHSTPGQETTSDPTSVSPDKKLTPRQKIPTFNEDPVTEPMKRSEERPTLKPMLAPEEKSAPGQGNTGLDQKFKPKDKVQTMNPKSETELLEKFEQNPSFESESKPDSTSTQKNTPDWVNTLPNQKLEPTEKTLTSDQQPVSDSKEETNENPSTDTANTENSTRGQKITPGRAKTRPDQIFRPRQKIPSANQQPETVLNRESNENPTIKATDNQDSTPEEKITPHHTDQRFEPSQDITTEKQKPVTDSIFETDKNLSFETVTNPSLIPEQKFTPDQDIRSRDKELTPRQGTTTFNEESVTETMKTSDKNPSVDITTKVDSTPGGKVTPGQDNTLPNQRFKPNKGSPTVNQKPPTNPKKKPEKNPTFKPKHTQDPTPRKKITPDQDDPHPDQKVKQNQITTNINPKFESESTEKSEENPLSPVGFYPDVTPSEKITPDQVNTRPDETSNPSQGFPTVNQKSESESTEESDENTSSNKDSTPGQTMTPDNVVTSQDRQLEPSEIIPKFDQEPVTELMHKTDKNPLSDPTSTSTPRQTLDPNQDNRRRDQQINISQEIPSIKVKPTTESVAKSFKNFTLKPHEGPTSGRKTIPEKVNTRPGQRFNPNQEIPTVNQKPVTDSMEESDESTSTNKDTTPEIITPDEAFMSPDQQLKPRQNTPSITQEPVTESMEKPDHTTNKASTPETSNTPDLVNSDQKKDQETKINLQVPTTPTKPVADSVEKSNQNFTLKPTSHQEPTSGKKKTTPGRVNIRPNQNFKPNQKIPTSNRKPPTKIKAESTNKDSTTPERISPGQKFKPNQMIPTINHKPTEVIDEFDEITSTNKDSTTIERVSPDQAAITPDQHLTPSQSKPTFDQDTATESKERSDPRTGPDQVNTLWDQRHTIKQEIPSINTVADSGEKSEKNITSKPSSHQDPTSARKKPTPGRVNTRPGQKFKPNQMIPTVNQKPTETMNEFDENVSTNKDSTPTERISPNEAVSTPDQHLTASPNIPTFDQEPVTESMKKSDSVPGQSILPDQVNTRQDQKPKINKEIPSINTKPVLESAEKPRRNFTSKSSSHQDPTSGRRKTTPEKVNTRPDSKFKPNQKIPKINQKPKPGQGLKPNQKPSKPVTDLKTKPNVGRKTDQAPHSNQRPKTPRPNLNPKPLPDEVSRAESNKTSKQRPPPPDSLPIRPTAKPGATPDQKPKQAARPEPSQRTTTLSDPPQISWTTSDGIHNSLSGVPPVSGPGKDISEVTHSTKGKEFNPSMRETVTLDPKSANSLETGPFPNLHTLPEDSTVSSSSRTASDLRPQTTTQPPAIPTTTQPDKTMRGTLPRYTPSTTQSTKPNIMLESDPDSQAELVRNMDEAASTIPAPPPRGRSTSTPSPDFRSATPATSGLEPPAAESSTPTARELRVKINQVAAFLNNSLSPNGRQPARHPKQQPEDTQGGSRPDGGDAPTRTPSKVSTVVRDCADHRLRGATRSGVYLVTPDLRSRSFRVFCDMEHDGGGWTVVQRRQDGSVSFNRTWTEYQAGFGEPRGGEFWLGNNVIHLLTRERDMALRVELEDFDGVEEYARYEHFRVASERLRYRLTVGGYSGTAGDALRFDKRYDHNNRAFTTPDRDNDRYPSGNCGAYYSSGWWFDACMAANLNGRYYEGSYKGVRDGIFWGTWHNISTEYYPTNDRQSFKRVRMMIRPKDFPL